MKAVVVNDMEPGKNPHGIDARRLLDAEYAQAVHIRLEPGESLRRHITHTDVLFYVLEGTGIVEIGDEKREVGPDTLIESPSGIPHCWYNESDGVLRVFVVKTPRPTESTTLL
ncbi:MAG: cupin domain-containing protein [Candidatus Eisenbacteria bacterium]|nr:cupin domain-containing protein [Candidatus Eisenbacteria bacterium]